MQRTRNRVLAVARELLPQVGPAGLTYALLAERADVTRQTLYRHWPTRAALLFDLVLEGPDLGTYPEPGSDVGAVATAWLKSLRAGVSVPAVRTAALAVTAQADHDPDSARALARIGEDRHAGFQQAAGACGRPDRRRRVHPAVRARPRPALPRPRPGHRHLHRRRRGPVAHHAAAHRRTAGLPVVLAEEHRKATERRLNVRVASGPRCKVAARGGGHPARAATTASPCNRTGPVWSCDHVAGKGMDGVMLGLVACG